MDRRHSLSYTTLLLTFLSLALFTSSIAAAFRDLSTVSYDEKFTPLFAEFNIKHREDGDGVDLHLNPYAGSGFISSDMYNYGFFSARIKLPGNHTSGIVVAIYTSNGDVFEKTHDELDIEFLGGAPGRPWRFQTNLYGNGSTNRGREERYTLWFDPSKEFHRYSILWTSRNIIFYVDNVPIREVMNSEEMGADYPSKPMALYATIWDASDWATAGGKYKVDYNFSPFIAQFKDLVLDGCPSDPIQLAGATWECSDAHAELDAADYALITPSRRASMRRFRQKFMYYSYCYDVWRYPVPLPECVIDPVEKERFKESGRLKFGGSHPRPGRQRRKRSRRSRGSSGSRNTLADYAM
uniref:Xyloglucan endotransglucosylase/hydrolase n=2 Tax=Kalanchoe fedtschenkoi TaxID=63787 RepID=A0A7N0V6I8_KALFE